MTSQRTPFFCIICSETFEFLRDVREPTPGTICSKCHQRYRATMSGDRATIECALVRHSLHLNHLNTYSHIYQKALVSCKICNMTFPGPTAEVTCIACKEEIRQGIQDPPNPDLYRTPTSGTQTAPPPNDQRLLMPPPTRESTMILKSNEKTHHQ
jgi:hypothetical protein